MTITFRAGASVLNAVATPNVTVARPVGTTNGDVLIAFIGRLGNVDVTPPAGWTRVDTSVNNPSGPILIAAFYKVAASEPSTWTFTVSSGISYGWVGAYTGVDPNTPITADHTNSQGAGTGFTAGSVSLLRGGAVVGAWVTVRAASGVATTWTPGAGYVERFETSSNNGTGNDISGEVVDGINTLGDRTVIPNGTASQSQLFGLSFGVALNPFFALPRAADVVPAMVEAAFGADLTADPSTWVWTDVSARLLGQITVTRGQPDEGQQTQPSQATIRLSNVDGWLTPRFPASPWYLLWALDTPVRASQQYPLGPYQRMQGYVSSIAPVWPQGSSQFAYVDIVVSGRLRNLNITTAPIRSSLTRGIAFGYKVQGSFPPLYYYPFEDSSGALVAAEFDRPRTPLTPSGPVDWASNSVLASSEPLATVPAGTIIQLVTPGAGVLFGSWRFSFVFSVPAAVSTTSVVMSWIMVGGTAQKWRLLLSPGSPPTMKLQAFSSTGIEQFGDTGIQLVQASGAAIPAGTPIFCTVQAKNVGANMTWAHQYATAGGGAVSENVSATSFQTGVMASITFAPDAILDGSAFGHLAFFYVSDALVSGSFVFTDWLYLNAHPGESVNARVTRLCAEEGIPLAITGTSDQTVGAQGINSVYQFLRDAEAVDGGILCDGTGPGLSLLTLASRQNAPVVLSLDANPTVAQVKFYGADSFAPVEDDQRRHDDVTVSRSGGSSARVVISPGMHATAVGLNLADDRPLLAQASWRAALGTVAEMRTPTIEINVRDTPALLRQWLRMDIGSRYTVANPPAQYPPGGLDLVLEYYTETFDGITHMVTLTGFPYAPFRSFTIGDSLLGRIVGTAHLTGGITATAPTLVLDNGGYVSTAANPADFPFDFDIEGEQVTVLSTTGTGSASIYTVTRSVNGVVKAHANAAPVLPWRPAGIAL